MYFMPLFEKGKGKILYYILYTYIIIYLYLYIYYICIYIVYIYIIYTYNDIYTQESSPRSNGQIEKTGARL